MSGNQRHAQVPAHLLVQLDARRTRRWIAPKWRALMAPARMTGDDVFEAHQPFNVRIVPHELLGVSAKPRIAPMVA
jgi:hypothetical protein